ncbi:MAG TPA: hypothetical protein PK412_04045, partial [bacterium]|nr:hypothetical protein [bacterium]
MAVDFFIIRIFSLAFVSFALAIGWTPLLTHFLYKYKLGKQIRDSAQAPIFSKLHLKKSGTPTMGGVLIWVTTLFVAILFFYLSRWFNGDFSRLSFLSRSQT